MAKLRFTPTQTLALLALLVVIVGALIAAPSSSNIQLTARHKTDTGRTSSPGVVAYGLVSPLCIGCGSRPKNFTPLVSANSQGVSLGSPQATPQNGAWCFRLRADVDASAVTVVASAEGSQSTELPGSHPTSIASAEWIVGAPDCTADEIEIRTMRYTATSSELAATTADDIPFSFVVLG